ncbi:putative retrotransposon hot spot (RHS) protein [Trypanosoma conorhini]|uniref:Putative retrotransposon hot spot (RHS) protein n=1 Tax=Trypanosoma conorhini TaxID=83891 RepID=A0A422N7S7_9TRYP|nr:putative retrotransposon hot spot (RHS) protein [Trypanosoma conorhini]RNF01528.1 putative retrotransposon hot spot (RHS) protein [Trypanosoma conorhini]
MGLFARRPDEYVPDLELLENITNLPASQPYALREELCGLVERGVVTLRRWRGYASWYRLSSAASNKPEPALEVAEAEAARREEKEMAKRGEENHRRPIPEGFCDSVFNAKLSHVLGFPEGAGDEMAVRMEAREGQAPKRSWEFMPDGAGCFLLSGIDQFRPPHPGW